MYTVGSFLHVAEIQKGLLIFGTRRLIYVRYTTPLKTLLNVFNGVALTSPTSGGRSVGIVRSRTKATELV
jgi:hypothetical protein